MYKCEDCNSTFDEPKEISAECFYGVSHLFNYSMGQTVSVCPNCEGYYEENEDVEE